MIKDLRLAVKLVLFILSAAAVIFGAAFGYNYYCSRRTVLKNVETQAHYLTLSMVYRIESELRAVEQVPTGLAGILERGTPSTDEINDLLKDAVARNPQLFGCAVACEPGVFTSAVPRYAHYAYRDKQQQVVTMDLLYEYATKDWYQIPREMRQPVWSEPYYDEGGGDILMCTYSVPFFHNVDGRREVAGVVTADLSLTWLQRTVAEVRVYETGYAFLISQCGVIVTHPRREFIMRESIFSIAESAGDPQLREIGRQMINGAQGFLCFRDFLTEQKAWLYFAPLPAIKWSLGVKFSEDELFADVRRLNRQVLLIGVLGFSVLALVIAFFSETITRPLRFLARTTREIAKGNLDVDIPTTGAGDEIGQLSTSFRGMQEALKEYISNLAQATAARERVESELKIAHTIQMSFLPKKFPPFPEKSEFEIYATLEPAKEVGGDLYDFFLLDEDHLFFTVGDVSGKGVPAALFMAVTKTLMKGVAESRLSPAGVLAKVNQELAVDNDSMMFTTVFCGLLNYRTGMLRFSNAGHNPPLIMRPNGVEWLTLPPGVVLGVDTGAEYRTAEMQLCPGDVLLVYTDGITEATNAADQLYSDAALLQTATGLLPVLSPEKLVASIMTVVKHFEEGVPPADDKTVLVLRFLGPPGPERS